MIKEPCKIVAIEHLTLDGIYQAPARPDEDTRNGFRHGGWSIAGNDQKMQEIINRYMVGGWSLLAGRTTYEDLFEAWSVRQPSNPMTLALTRVQKFVTCHDFNYNPLWENSVLLVGDATETVAKLKKEHDKTLVIFGSGALVRSLMQQRLVDEFVLMFHPLVLGEGRRFFDNEAPFTKLKLTDETITDTGVIITTYQLA
jgi:dihydrofolate reductase